MTWTTGIMRKTPPILSEAWEIKCDPGRQKVRARLHSAVDATDCFALLCKWGLKWMNSLLE